MNIDLLEIDDCRVGLLWLHGIARSVMPERAFMDSLFGGPCIIHQAAVLVGHVIAHSRYVELSLMQLHHSGHRGRVANVQPFRRFKH